MSGRILVVDDIPTNRALLKAKLTTAYYDVITADGGIAGLERARAEQPDMILLDVMMPDLDGYMVCEELKADPLTAHIPVIMITASGSTDQRVRGLEAGADDFLSRPFVDLALFARVRNLMRVKMMIDELRLRDATTRELGLQRIIGGPARPEAETGRLLIAASDILECSRWALALKDRIPLEVIEAVSEADALASAAAMAPDVYVVHQRLIDGGDGLRLVSALRARAESRQSAIIFVAEADALQIAAAALDLGASDYAIAPLDPNELVARIRSQLRRKRYSDALRSNVIDGLRMAVTDPLTGLYNRRYADQHLTGLMERARQDGTTISILMLDLDEFKSVNDTYGHEVGDAILQEFGRRLQNNVRGIDLVARLGGEEFVVAMPETDVDDAAYVAERVRRAIETRPFVIDTDGRTVDVTVSIGVAVSTGEERDAEVLIRQADVALYSSKNNGRNKVSIFPEAA